MNFVIAAYYTKGPGYENEARRLIRSLKQNLPPCALYHVEAVPNMGSWNKNTHFKPHFILRTLDSYRLPVLYLDCDAVVWKYPALFDTLDADFAVHYFRGYQLASGTLFFADSQRSRQLIESWIAVNELNPHGFDQQNLQDAVKRFKEDPGDLKIYRLPAEYCLVFDLEPGIMDPYIEHFQASRNLKRSVEEVPA